MSKILDLVAFYLRIEKWYLKLLWENKNILPHLNVKGVKMKKVLLIVSAIIFLNTGVFAGCMKSEINEIDAKLKSSSMSAEKKAEISKLRDIVVSNEHSNAELAFESYEKAISLLN